MVEYLLEKYSDGALNVPCGTPERAEYLQVSNMGTLFGVTRQLSTLLCALRSHNFVTSKQFHVQHDKSIPPDASFGYAPLASTALVSFEPVHAETILPSGAEEALRYRRVSWRAL